MVLSICRRTSRKGSQGRMWRCSCSPMARRPTTFCPLLLNDTALPASHSTPFSPGSILGFAHRGLEEGWRAWGGAVSVFCASRLFSVSSLPQSRSWSILMVALQKTNFSSHGPSSKSVNFKIPLFPLFLLPGCNSFTCSTAWVTARIFFLLLSFSYPDSPCSLHSPTRHGF